MQTARPHVILFPCQIDTSDSKLSQFYSFSFNQVMVPGYKLILNKQLMFRTTIDLTPCSYSQRLCLLFLIYQLTSISHICRLGYWSVINKCNSFTLMLIYEERLVEPCQASINILSVFVSASSGFDRIAPGSL